MCRSGETGYNFTVLPNINRDLAAPKPNQPVKELQMNKLIVALIAGTFAAVASAQTPAPAQPAAPAAAPAAPAKQELKKDEMKKDDAKSAADKKKADKEAAAAKKKADKEAKAAKKKADKEAAAQKKDAAEKAAGDTRAPGMTQAQKDKMGQADLKAQEKTTGGSK